MPNIHASIPTTSLPTELAVPNKIVTKYETFTLIPRLGPLTYTHLRTIGLKHWDRIKTTYLLLDAVQKQKDEWSVAPILFLDPSVVVLEPPPIRNYVPKRVINVDRTSTVAHDSHVLLDILHDVRGLSTSDVEILSLEMSASNPNANNQLVNSNSFILQAMRESNPIVKRLVESGKLIDKNGEFRMDLAALPPAEKMTKILKASTTKGRKSNAVETALAKTIFDEVSSMHIKDNLKDVVLTEAKLITNSIADALRSAGIISDDMQSVDDSVIVDSREWAFLRHERVELIIGQPQFRGPLSVDSVAPNSELSYSSSQTVANQQIGVASNERGSRSGTSQLVSSKIKEKLGTLYDYGSNLGQTMSEQGFSRDVSKGEKRSMVEATLLEISEKNASKTISASTVSSALTREYRTEGKDTDFATTAVSFEAFAPVEVTHYLDEIGAVWSPRMRNPFLALHRRIERFERNTQAQYIAENYVVDPAEPLPSYEGFERITVNTKKVLEKDYKNDDTNHIYRAEVTIELTDAQSNNGYFLDADVELEFIQDTSDDDFEADQYRVFDPVVVNHVPNKSITISTRVQILDFPFWDDPDYFYLKVSVSKYKYTAAYLEQLKDYNKTIGEVNIVRRAAVKAQAKKYARLKKEELISRYHNDPVELRDYTFISLMKMMFGVSADAHWSYYHGIIKSCIDWDNARFDSEPADPSHLAADGLSPYHFLNVNAIRFFLPIHKGSEAAFFEAVGNTMDADWAALFEKVKEYIDTQRNLVALMTERMNDEDMAQLTLDKYKSELVLGQHLEAVLSQTKFLER